MDGLNRGDVVTVALQGEFGKPRPAVIVQSDTFNATHATISIVPITSTIEPAPLFRITVEPSAANGLRSVSQIMTDKVVSVRRERLGVKIGVLDRETMARIGRSLALWLELA
ncbi:MAG: type II toxin-antitoxin system PemK/MazF family toxin [Reyranellaceae bacterium]